MYSDSDMFGVTIFGAFVIPIVLGCVGLLLLYGIVRVAVARGMRDHQLWMEKNRPASGDQPYQRRIQ
jgi:uncharacterized membrane protein